MRDPAAATALKNEIDNKIALDTSGKGFSGSKDEGKKFRGGTTIDDLLNSLRQALSTEDKTIRPLTRT